MKAMEKTDLPNRKENVTTVPKEQGLDSAIKNSWSKIAPFWPLKNLIAVNPVAGFEDMAFEDALKQAQAYFRQRDLPAGMQSVNRESIKWLQAFFDNGQATISMPNREQGFLKATLSLMKFDKHIHQNDRHKKEWLNNLPAQPEKIIAEAFLALGIPSGQQEQFLTLMLTTLPGWAAHIRYRTQWADAEDAVHPYPVSEKDYLAFRLVTTCLVWPAAKELLSWHKKALRESNSADICARVIKDEIAYQTEVFQKIEPVQKTSAGRAKAQMVFCIDVRSEPFRRAVEAQGGYETFGFAGFFGVPVAIENGVTGESYASCPVLLKPAYNVTEQPSSADAACHHGHKRAQGLKKLYQSVKYTFATPFCLVETIGAINGAWMGVKSLSPRLSTAIQSTLKRVVAGEDQRFVPQIDSIPFDQQVAYSAGALKTMGLTENFAPLVVFCGHGSTTQNNAYATALDCGACGGRHGAPNARILAAILNLKTVRQALATQGMSIPEDTVFVGAEHNTTTDHVDLFDDAIPESHKDMVADLKQDLVTACIENSLWRSHEMDVQTTADKARHTTGNRSQDWAQVRPEWGLAKNAAFIVAPRWLTKDVDLQGRSFLHSYDWEKDSDGAALTTILTAPMVVAQWINTQYFFSTLDNVAFGGGSKVTKNITGKIGIMQGNASDLMHGLPLQSVFKSDDTPYHKLLRLTVMVYAPRPMLDRIITEQAVLKKLFGNGWVHLLCHDPVSQQKFWLQRDLTWVGGA